MRRRVFNAVAAVSRPIRRQLFTLCSAASLLLCVAVGVLWVRSYGAIEEYFGVVRVAADDGFTEYRQVSAGTVLEPGRLLLDVSRSAHHRPSGSVLKKLKQE